MARHAQPTRTKNSISVQTAPWSSITLLKCVPCPANDGPSGWKIESGRYVHVSLVRQMCAAVATVRTPSRHHSGYPSPLAMIVLGTGEP